MDLTEGEDIKKRWQEYTEELYKKDLHDQDNNDGMITHLEPDILDVKSSGPPERRRPATRPPGLRSRVVQLKYSARPRGEVRPAGPTSRSE